MEPPSSVPEVSETDIGGLGYLGRMRYGVIRKRECSCAHEWWQVESDIHSFLNSCAVLILKWKNRRKNTHTKGIVDLGSFRIHLTAVLSRQTRSRSDHQVTCGEL